MPRHQPSLGYGPQESATDIFVDVINHANHIFAGHHNWLSPLTSDEERIGFISRCCEWWNCFACPAMDQVGATWNEAQHRFELPQRNKPATS